MLSQLWALKQGNKTVTEYEANFNRLVKFSPDGFRDNELMKVKKFRDGLTLELQHDVRGFEINTVGELVTKVRMMEELRNKIKVQDNASKSVLGKRSFGYYGGKSYESGSGSGKKTTVEKTQSQGQGNQGNTGYGKIKRCSICFGPHSPHECK